MELTATQTLKPHEALAKYFGYNAFRPLQEKIIDRIIGGKDCLVLMPTGGGKSICYQVPALCMPGTAIVISPLISLMKDQVDALKANGINAAYLNSTQSGGEQQHIEKELREGKLKLLYLAPERLLTGRTESLLKQVTISLIAIDEAHCISQWGHDFRPEYTALGKMREHFPNTPFVALTATADKLTRQDILKQLNLQDSEQFISSFDRPNLSLEVRPARQRFEQLLEFVRKRHGDTGIVYCLSRKTTEEIADKFKAKGIKALAYHAGLSPDDRGKVQDHFVNDRVDVICATIAFGMGIDKSNVRYVVHYNLPKHIESYYQEIGRAGRDGLPSDTLLFYAYGDLEMLRSFIADDDRKEMQMEKLKRMQEYAEAKICRRKVLLNYFNEYHDQNCGNCDVCKNPPQYFDATVLAQKALSAVARVNERVGMSLLTDILRGSQRKEIIEHGYDQIKTYGAGREIPTNDWLYYLQQLIQLGYLEIAYDAGHTLKLTPASTEVLRNGKAIHLARMEWNTKKEDGPGSRFEPRVTKQEQFEKALFEHLRQLRKQISDEEQIPAYVVFSDATLKEMVTKLPVTQTQLQSVSGVGQEKLQRYGEIFTQSIRKFMVHATETGIKKVKGSTYLQTLDLYEAGKNPFEIGVERAIAEGTVFGHLAHLVQEGHQLDLDRVLTNEERAKVMKAWELCGKPDEIAPVFEMLGETVMPGKIRLIVAEHMAK